MGRRAVATGPTPTSSCSGSSRARPSPRSSSPRCPGTYQDTLDRWELAIDAAGVGSFDWDLTTGELLWDDRLLAVFGYGRDEFGRTIEDFEARVHPDDRARTRAVLAAAREECSTWAMDYRVVHPSGETRWVTARGRALRGAGGVAERMLGAAYDSTDLHDGEARTARVLEAMSAAFYSLDRDWRFTYVNAEAERLLGRRREELLGGVIWELFPAAVGSDFEVNYRAAAETGEATRLRGLLPGAARRLVRAAGLAVAGRPVGLLPRHHRPTRRRRPSCSGPRGARSSSPT